MKKVMVARGKGMKHLLLAVAVSFAMPYMSLAAYEDYVYMEATDGYTDSTSFNTAGKWSDHEPPSPTKKYYVPVGIDLRTPNTNVTDYVFGGSELVLAGAINPLSRMNSIATITNLVMLGGSRIYYSGQKTAIQGTAHVQDSSLSNPANVASGMDLGETFSFWVQELGFDFVGAADQVLKVRQYGGVENKANTLAVFAFTHSLSNFLGTLVIAKKSWLSITGPCGGPVNVESSGRLCSAYFHGNSANDFLPEHYWAFNHPEIPTLTLAAGGELELYTNTTVTAGDCTMGNGAKILVHVDKNSGTTGLFTVTNSLTVSGKVAVNIKCTLSELPLSAPTTNVFMRLAPSAANALTEDDIEVSGGIFVAALPHWIVGSRLLGDGSREFFVTRRAIVKMLRTENIETKGYSQFNCATNASGLPYWSDGAAPSPEKDYYSDISGSLSSPDGETVPTFAGASLTVRSSTSIMTGNKAPMRGIRVDDFHPYGAGLLKVWQGTTYPDSYELVTYLLQGKKLTLYGEAGSWILRPFGNKLLRIENEFFGNGSLTVTTEEAASAEANVRGTVELTGLNTNWTGSISVTMTSHYRADRSGSKDVPSEIAHAALIVRDGRNLGGPLKEFKYNSLSMNQMSRLRAVADVSLDQANRGVLISGMARFDVDAGKMLSIRNPLTLKGRMRKQGAGTLALGGSLRFINGAEDTAPLAGTNVMELAAGALKPLATNAFDGAAIEITNATAKILFDIAPEADGLREYGLLNTKWATPLTLSGAATSINVEFDKTGHELAPPEMRWSVGLFTVSTEALAEDIAGKVNATSPYTSSRVKCSYAQNALGSWTVTATFTPRGLGVYLR